MEITMREWVGNNQALCSPAMAPIWWADFPTQPQQFNLDQQHRYCGTNNDTSSMYHPLGAMSNGIHSYPVATLSMRWLEIAIL
jgi:hypothetical protein